MREYITNIVVQTILRKWGVLRNSQRVLCLSSCHDEHRLSLCTKIIHHHTRIFFRDTLIEGQEKAPVKENKDLLASGLVNLPFDEGNCLLPKVTLDEKYF